MTKENKGKQKKKIFVFWARQGLLLAPTYLHL